MARALGDHLLEVAEVEAVAAFVGTPSPMDFNGLVRHYYLRDGPHMADLRVTLADRVHRRQQSHALLLRLRRALTAIAADHGARVKLVEVHPGPPVVATLTVELYGQETTPYATLERAEAALRTTRARLAPARKAGWRCSAA